MRKMLQIIVGVLLLNPVWATTIIQSEDAIRSIREHYTLINGKAGSYRKVKKELSGFSTEGGELIAYFHGPSVMKMVANFFGESGKAIEEYYYWEGKLIFVFRKEARYDKPLSGKIVANTENRFYFADDKLIRWVDENGKEITSSSAEYGNKQREYLKTSKQLSEGARSSKSTIQSDQ